MLHPKNLITIIIQICNFIKKKQTNKNNKTKQYMYIKHSYIKVNKLIYT